jgi:pyruvate ferredoxin oxidoreductase beta subunit
MSLNYVKFSPGFESFMPKEYRDMVEHGPFGKKTTVSQMGSFKEILEEHPMCAGCAMTLFIRLAIVAFPNPEDTITVGTAGCGRLAISQAAIPFVYGNYGDQNGVASGLSRGLRIRFGDQHKAPPTSDSNKSSIPGSGRNGSRRSCWIMRCMGIRADKKAV